MSSSVKDLEVLVDSKLSRSEGPGGSGGQEAAQSQEGLPALPTQTLEHSDCPA